MRKTECLMLKTNQQNHLRDKNIIGVVELYSGYMINHLIL